MSNYWRTVREKLIAAEQIIEQTMKPFQGKSEKGVDCSTLTGKVMCGYQGWHAAEGDDCGRGWYHWTGRNGFKPGSTNVDLWPDVSELGPDERYATAFWRLLMGDAAEVYSGPSTPRRWCGISSGCRIAGSMGCSCSDLQLRCSIPAGLWQFNTVLTHCRVGAEQAWTHLCGYVRSLSGMRAGRGRQGDGRLETLSMKRMQITKDPAYLASQRQAGRGRVGLRLQRRTEIYVERGA